MNPWSSGCKKSSSWLGCCGWIWWIGEHFCGGVEAVVVIFLGLVAMGWSMGVNLRGGPLGMKLSELQV
jgi:hypothetical protein